MVRESLTLRCFSLILLQVGPIKNISVQMYKVYSGLYKEVVTQNGHMIALICLPVPDLSPPKREVMVCTSFRYPRAVLSGSMLMQRSQVTLKSGFHILHICFSIGKSPFCLPEVLVTFPVTKRVVTIPFGKC